MNRIIHYRGKQNNSFRIQNPEHLFYGLDYIGHMFQSVAAQDRTDTLIGKAEVLYIFYSIYPSSRA